ncbi:MAG: hypothetical protein IJP38_02925 [Oscillospiraceae bacterium]|nr:hypothetical protein [Oscillospiraceae bacterium]
MKKMISILIALTMLVSVIPSAFAEGEEVEGPPVAKKYTFNYSAINLSTSTVLSEIDSTAVDKDNKNIYETYGWKYFDMSEALKAKELKDSSGNKKHVALVWTTANHLFFHASAGVPIEFALSLKAPEISGFYVPILNWYSGNNNASLDWYLSKSAAGMTTVEQYLKTENFVATDSQTTANNYELSSPKAIYTTGDDEILTAFSAVKSKQYKFVSITLNPLIPTEMITTVNETNTVSLNLTDADTTNDTATASTTVSGKTIVGTTETSITNMPVSNKFITYKSSNDAVAKVAADGTITAVGNGTATIYAESSDEKYSSSENGITVTVTAPAEPEDDEALSDAFDAKEETVNTYVESTVTGITEDTTIKAEKNSDGTFSLTAPETKSDKKFLYWAKGMSANKKIVSFDSVLSDYMPEEDGKNYLVAVYEGDVSDIAEYYNANGQRIATKTEPALPSMAGFGKATGWKKYGETNIYVAEYAGKTQPDNVTVTVDGKEETVPYGTEIVCTADSTKANFKCWTKSDINGKTEIVSANETYKFNAWEDCEVTAIYEDHIYKGDKFKIIIDTFTVGEETGVMAEFIGLDNAVEKGIMFGTKKIAMTRPGNQFTVTADKDGTFKGYAIVGNVADGYTMITDGEITVTAGK